jgi:hypothetical protein
MVQENYGFLHTLVTDRVSSPSLPSLPTPQLPMLMFRSCINIHRSLSSFHYLASIIIFGQMINLVFNLSSDTVSQFRVVRIEHVQALLVATAILTLCGCTSLVRGNEIWSMLEATVLFPPLLVSFGSWVLKRSELDMENQLKDLEGKRYKMKGA